MVTKITKLQTIEIKYNIKHKNIINKISTNK